MTTDELIAQVLEHDAKATAGPWVFEVDCLDAEDGLELNITDQSGCLFIRVIPEEPVPNGQQEKLLELPSGAAVKLIIHYRTAAPKLARMLQRAMEALREIEGATDEYGPEVEIATEAILLIEAMLD